LPIALPEDLELTKNVVYRWRFEVQSVPLDYVEGNFSLEPEEISLSLLASLAMVSPIERLEFYLEQGWWYESIHSFLTLEWKKNKNYAVMELAKQLLNAEGFSFAIFKDNQIFA
jgi:hypothetical protein